MEVKNYPNYLIYEDGKIWSKCIKKYLIGSKDKDGYKIIGLWKNNKCKRFRLNRLVALHFIPNPENLEMVDHIDRCKTNNRVENLRWVDRSTNCLNCKRKPNLLNEPNIAKHSTKGFQIRINRNKVCYNKYCSTLDEAIKQRDLMLSMFIKK